LGKVVVSHAEQCAARARLTCPGYEFTCLNESAYFPIDVPRDSGIVLSIIQSTTTQPRSFPPTLPHLPATYAAAAPRLHCKAHLHLGQKLNVNTALLTELGGGASWMELEMGCKYMRMGSVWMIQLDCVCVRTTVVEVGSWNRRRSGSMRGVSIQNFGFAEVYKKCFFESERGLSQSTQN
jgi:hypothetical protein